MTLKIGLVLLFGFAFCSAFAQPFSSNNGTFEVDQVEGCAPLTINLTVPTAVCDPPASNCDFFYETGSIQNVFTYTYNTPGVYNLVGVFQGGITDRITITVLPDTPPEFEIYSCGGNGVQVNITDTRYERYVVNFNDATMPVETSSMSTVTHMYASSGNKTITVHGRNLGATDNCSPVSETVNAVPVLPVPVITQLTVLNNQDIQLEFSNQANILYRLQIAPNSSASFQNLQNVYETSTTTVNNLQTDNNFYCFRLGAFDPCNNTTTFSNTICSSNFDVAALNNLNRLTWATSSAGVTSHTFSRNADPPLNAAGGAVTLDDTNVVCGMNYCYQQTMNYANGSRSVSLSVCATAQSTNIPTAVQNISAVVGGETSVQLQWIQDPAFIASEYTITKIVNGLVASTNSTATPGFTDNEYAYDITSCYRISYSDACNNKSPESVEVCPIKLLATLQADNTVSLSWTPFEGWVAGVDRYIIEKFNGTGQLLQTVTVPSGTEYTDNTQNQQEQIVVYRLTAIANESGIVPSVSNSFNVTKEPNLFHPTAFTPNNDGLNDIFTVYGQYVESFEMRIFNRWGEMMYVTEDLDEGWNGHYKGSLMPEGTYVFRATITDQAGRTFERSGPFVLLKKN